MLHCFNVGRQLLSELRRSPRIVCRVPLLVFAGGTPVLAHSAVINRHGALVHAEGEWPANSRLEVQNQETKESTPCRVTWSGGEERPGLYKTGLEFLEDHPHFWGEHYPETAPPPPTTPTSATA